MFSGCYTALITPMTPNHQVNYEGLQRLIEFQIREGVSGILAVGTTGESPTLDWNEHNKVIEKVHEYTGSKGLTIAGTGSNSTQETIDGTEHAADIGVKCVLLVDPYYNGPSSLEIRKEYVEPVASRFPEVQVIPYVIPGRTGTQLYPQDLAVLHQQYPNVSAVKEATGNLDNMRLTRKLCGSNFAILSGDDDQTFNMMTAPDIAAVGAISVASNIAPRAVQSLTQALLAHRTEEANKLYAALKPLFSIVTVKTLERTQFGSVTCKARNPLAFKTLMNVLGMASGPCRQPLGKMTKAGIEIVLSSARKVYETNPAILQPIADFFSVDLRERLYNERFWQGLIYA
ncbi:dihydrodipicolinate synthase [miscellaneous Crenarchaeota group-1 archaeon SG8-32-3]|uniref:4-hydroxy-tetrahydrodipicolinate synthase n=1 Tax=miscellaneous Crenarchaeota group-1 archaeon SG8-32-3 TaxID=1685125 RepID=A0A0M0BRQ4_9ARCH|nr:MAG: dihydrodipicolinate synthase [miscellaneous Crenarchaeota group-1 archaeon SG8-32-3]